MSVDVEALLKNVVKSLGKEEVQKWLDEQD